MINISDVQKFSHLQLQIPSSRVVILTTDCLHVNNLLRRFYISNFKELPLDSTVLTGEFKYRRVRISPVLIGNS